VGVVVGRGGALLAVLAVLAGGVAVLPPIVVIFPVNVISFGLVVSGVTTTNSSISYFDGDAAGTGAGGGGGGGGGVVDAGIDAADAVNPGTADAAADVDVGAADAAADVDVGAAADPDPYTDDGAVADVGVVDISNYKREFFKSFSPIIRGLSSIS